MLIKKGLALGASESNALIFDGDCVLNNGGLRYYNEPVRHKVLDLIGDFTLLGTYLKGHVLSYGGGHFSNTEFMKKIKLEYEKI